MSSQATYFLFWGFIIFVGKFKIQKIFLEQGKTCIEIENLGQHRIYP